MSQKLDVFISYARADGSPFATGLHAALEAAGFDASLDQHDIVPGEPWEDRLRRLLQKADTVIYVVTPAAVQSERCAWEIEEAERLRKRVIPVVAIEVPMQDLPAALSRLNFIFFTRDKSFGEALLQLATALRTDAGWIREHSQYLNEAASWIVKGKPDDQLLMGSRLEGARTWLAGWKPGAPEPTQDQRAFLAASEAAEARRNDTRRQELEEKERLLKRSSRAMRVAQVTVGLMLAGVIGGGAYLIHLRAQAAADRVSADTAWRVADAAELTLLETQRESDERQNAIDALIQQLKGARDAGGMDRNLQESINEALDASSGAAPDGGLGDGSPGRGPASTEQPEMNQTSKGVLGGWNIDVFACDGPGAATNMVRQARVIAALAQEQAAQTAIGAQQGVLPIGGVRPKTLSVETNARPGYQVRSDQIRAELIEEEAANQLGAILSSATGLTLQQIRSKTRTVNYISVFLCSGES